MENLFKKFSKTGVLVIGDLMIDQYIWGKVRRISPEAPVPVVEVSEENLLLGGAANVANNIISLGGKVFVSGVIGKDEMGRILAQKFREKGVQTEGIIMDSERVTTVKTRVVAHNQQVVRFDRETRHEISSSTLAAIMEYTMSCLPRIKAIIISDYSKGVITRSLIKKLLKLSNSSIFIAVDPKIGHFKYYNGVNLITPNLDEASAGSGINIMDEKTLIMAGETLLKKLQCEAVLITKGDRGMSLFERDGGATHIPTFAKEVYDVTGAGDTVIATFTLCRSAGAKSREAAILANRAAGIVVGEIGTTVITQEKLLKSMNGGKI